MRGFLVQRWVRHCGIMALLVCILALSGCQFFWQSSLPPLPQGWSWYHDSVYPFDLAVPSGWQAFGYWTEITQGDHCYRTVDLVPAAYVQVYHSNPERVFESISLSVPTYPENCERDTTPIPPQWKIAGPSTLGGKTATLYTYVYNDAELDSRSVKASFGDHQYSLSFYDEKSSYQVTDPQFQQFDASQLAIFDTVRENFTYHG